MTLVQAGTDALLARGPDSPCAFVVLRIEHTGYPRPEPGVRPHMRQLRVGVFASGLARAVVGEIAPGLWAVGPVLLCALRERGLSVPADVRIVGFDDVPEAAYLYPALTTVRQDFGRLGEIIMQKVLIAVEEPDSATEDPPCRLIWWFGLRRGPSPSSDGSGQF